MRVRNKKIQTFYICIHVDSPVISYTMIIIQHYLTKIYIKSFNAIK